MTLNSIAVIDREIVSGSIEGVDFGPKLWVIARSPNAVLAWVYGHSASINGHQSYYQPHLLILPDRTPRFLHNPRYISLSHEWTRLRPDRLDEFHDKIVECFGTDAYTSISRAVKDRMTVVIEGGGGSLLPVDCYNEAHHDWTAQGNGFVVLPEGMKRHDMFRHKLGWKPQ